jgi:kynurenine formamidase
MEPISVELLEHYYEQCSNWEKWGANDQRGTLNFISPEKISEAAGLVRTGDIFSLQLPLDQNGPQTGAFGRVNAIHQMVATGTDHLSGAQQYPLGFGYADDSIFMFLQGGTQWDGLAHIFRNGLMYNGNKASEVTSAGAAKNGIEQMPAIATRGVLLDLPLIVERPYLEPGEAITPILLDEACAAHGVEIEAGDAVLIRTGDMARRRTLPGWDSYSAGDSPGLSLRCAPWLYEHQVAAIATDTWGVEVRPNEISESFQPLHLVMVVRMGLLVGEIWYLDQLAEHCHADGRYTFLLVAPPLVIPGAVGSPLNPQALK